MKKRAWLFLIAAVLIEVSSTLVMKVSGSTGRPEHYAFMYLLISASYFCLSQALKKIPLGTAIGIWEATGVSLIAIFSTLFFGEVLLPRKILGLVLATVGIILLKSESAREETLLEETLLVKTEAKI